MDSDFLNSVNNEITDIFNLEKNRKLNIVDLLDSGRRYDHLEPGNNVEAFRTCEIDPLIFDKKKELNLTCTVPRRADLVESGYILFYLHDHFDPNNTNNLLDTLYGTEIELHISGNLIFNIQLGLLYFLSNYLKESIYYVDLNVLQDDIQKGASIDYKFIIDNIMKDKTKTNKILLIPLSFNFLAKNIGLANAGYSTIEFRLKNKENHHIQTMVKTINFLFLNLEIWDNQIRQNLIGNANHLKTTTCEALNKQFENSTITFQVNVTNCKYFTIAISPQYEKIDKDLWQMIPSLLPEIQSIITTSSGTQEFMIENADIRKSNSQIVYFFSGDPNYTMQNWIKKHMSENDDMIDRELGNYVDQDNKQADNNLLNRQRVLRVLEITLTNSTIPINVNICTFFQNILAYSGGVSGLSFSHRN